MNVLFVSQCSGNALTETRRILDQFAERRGERSWFTPITWEGLKTIHKLLRQLARKNTAVACFWLHRSRSELMWIVGDARRFNERGTTPTNSTSSDILRSHDEDDWHHGEIIRLLASLAALFHDFGKANTAFQEKLLENAFKPDPIRHEWVSLQIFAAFVCDAADDRIWLERLSATNYPKANVWRARLDQDIAPFKSLPPLARAIGWLILTHHRLPLPVKDGELKRSSVLKDVEQHFQVDWGYATEVASDKERGRCWRIQKLPWDSPQWQRHAARLASRLLQENCQAYWLDNPYVAHLARLTLMLADHYYSSQASHPRYGALDFPLYANTDKCGNRKQRLDEHLIGVALNASRIAHTLPRIPWQLPRIARHRALRRPTREEPFLWQNRAFALAEDLREESAVHGFFGVNLASAGCGKTLANARILYALANPNRGARFTVGLGLRILTLQTGEVYRKRFHLGSEDLAVLIGGGAIRELHAHNQKKVQQAVDEENLPEKIKVLGSESAEELLGESQYVHFEGSLNDGPLKLWLENQSQALVQAPIVVCTVDHLAPATESLRGGQQILPMLRLLTSDLVLDEVDDFDVQDLPALTRLIHWAGMLGSRVLLSSATLPPALVYGFFQAYIKGREIFQDNRGVQGSSVNICCAWFDEFDVQNSNHDNLDFFVKAHENFTERRLRKLAEQPQRRHAAILPVTAHTNGSDPGKMHQLCSQLAACLRDQAIELHRANSQEDPQSGRRVSVGLVRMANIDPLVDTARSLLQTGMPDDMRLHLAVYHARFPLFQRSRIEQRLDLLLQRHDPLMLFRHAEMRRTIDAFPESEQIFLVMATPVAEVGRDHDYDWAIVEPSSMRSIIQLAGRIRRHRLEQYCKVNLCLLSRNLRALRGDQIAYSKPGYESQEFLLSSHDLMMLLRPEQRDRIDASPRISEYRPLNFNAPNDNLADLEHKVLHQLMLGAGNQRPPVKLWWETHAYLSGVLQKRQLFRAGRPTETYLFLPDDDGELHFHRLDAGGCYTRVDNLLEPLEVRLGPRCNWWDEKMKKMEDAQGLLEQLAEDMALELDICAQRYATVDLETNAEGEGWWYHPSLGFSRKRSS